MMHEAPATPRRNASGAPDNSSLSHFSAMTWPSWLCRTVRNRHRHAIEQASRRWRGGGGGDSGRTRRKFDFHTGERQGAINAAQGQAESMRLKATAEADQIKAIAEAQAASTRMAAEATADGLRAIAEAVSEEGGKDAMVQRLADKYVSELAEMAKQSNLVIVPDRPNDISGVVATAMGMFDQVKQQGSESAK